MITKAVGKGERGWAIMSEYYLVRHGKSEGNDGFATVGPATIKLTERGWLQAKLSAVALYFLGVRPDCFGVSPYVRARQTALPFQDLYPDTPSEEWPIHEFDYLAAFHGLRSTVADRKAAADAYWNHGEPSFEHSAGSESFATFAGRVAATLDRLAHVEQTVVLFGHEQFFNMLLYQIREGHNHVNRAYMADYRQFLHEHKLPNGSITRLDIASGQWSTLFVPKVDPSVIDGHAAQQDP